MSVHSRILKVSCPNFTKFSVYVPVAVAQSAIMHGNWPGTGRHWAIVAWWWAWLCINGWAVAYNQYSQQLDGLQCIWRYTAI